MSINFPTKFPSDAILRSEPIPKGFSPEGEAAA